MVAGQACMELVIAMKKFFYECWMNIQLFFVLAFWCCAFLAVYVVAGLCMVVEKVFGRKSA